MPVPSSESWRVVLFTDQAVIVNFYKEFLPDQGHRLVGLVTSRKRNHGYLDVVGAAPAGVDVILSERPRRWAGMVATLRPDLIISNVFPWMIPDDTLAIPRLGAVNIHGGLLPAQRGTDGGMWLLREGATETGMTLHRTIAGFDTGPILAQERCPIEEDDEPFTIIRRFFPLMPRLWATALPRIARGDPGEPQDETQARYFGHIPDEAAWKTIDWTQPAQMVHNVVRSSIFARDLPPGAVGGLDGVPHRIIKTRLLPDSKGAGRPGSVVARDEDMLLVQCGDGLLGVVKYEPV